MDRGPEAAIDSSRLMSPQDTPSAWSPILAPDAAESAAARGRRDRGRSPRGPRPAAPGGADLAPPGTLLAGGDAGLACFFTYLDQVRPGQGYDDLAMHLLERAIDGTGAMQAPPGLYSGFSGVAWTLEHLRGRLFEEDGRGGPRGGGGVGDGRAPRPHPLEGALRPHLGPRRLRGLRPRAPPPARRPGVPGAHGGPPGGDRGTAGRRPGHLAHRPGAHDRARAGDLSAGELQPRRGPRRAGSDRRAGAGLRRRGGRPGSSWTAPSPGCSPRSCRRRRTRPSPTASRPAPSRGPPGSPGATATWASPPRC